MCWAHTRAGDVTWGPEASGGPGSALQRGLECGPVPAAPPSIAWPPLAAAPTQLLPALPCGEGPRPAWAPSSWGFPRGVQWTSRTPLWLGETWCVFALCCDDISARGTPVISGRLEGLCKLLVPSMRKRVDTVHLVKGLSCTRNSRGNGEKRKNRVAGASQISSAAECGLWASRPAHTCWRRDAGPGLPTLLGNNFEI